MCFEIGNVAESDPRLANELLLAVVMQMLDETAGGKISGLRDFFESPKIKIGDIFSKSNGRADDSAFTAFEISISTRANLYAF